MRSFRILRRFRIDWDIDGNPDDVVVTTVLVWATEEEALSLLEKKKTELVSLYDDTKSRDYNQIKARILEAAERVEAIEALDEGTRRILGISLMSAKIKLAGLKRELDEFDKKDFGSEYWAYVDLDEVIDKFNFSIDPEGRIGDINEVLHSDPHFNWMKL